MIPRAIAAWLAALLLAGCATVVQAPRDAKLFDLLGRVFVAYSGGAVSANVRWEHSGERDEIWLMTPTGQTLAHILDSVQGATLTRADQQQYRAANVETLTQQGLGWTLPLGSLQYWVRGLPAPGSTPTAVERGAGDRIQTMTQNGWRVAFTYHGEGEQTGMVRRLDLKDGANEIRFVVDTWRSTEP